MRNFFLVFGLVVGLALSSLSSYALADRIGNAQLIYQWNCSISEGTAPGGCLADSGGQPYQDGRDSACASYEQSDPFRYACYSGASGDQKQWRVFSCQVGQYIQHESGVSYGCYDEPPPEPECPEPGAEQFTLNGDYQDNLCVDGCDFEPRFWTSNSTQFESTGNTCENTGDPGEPCNEEGGDSGDNFCGPGDPDYEEPDDSGDGEPCNEEGGPSGDDFCAPGDPDYEEPGDDGGDGEPCNEEGGPNGDDFCGPEDPDYEGPGGGDGGGSCDPETEDCDGEGEGECDPETEECPDSGVSGGTCSENEDERTPPDCEDDTGGLECAVALNTWEIQCDQELWQADLRGSENYNNDPDGDSLLNDSNEKNEIRESQVDVSEYFEGFDDDGFLSGSSDAPVYDFEVFGQSYEVDMVPMWELAEMLGYLILAMAYFWAACIVAEGI
ncbi:MAG: virulence factor TspB C-terminal domain-related protein [Alcanivorax sp.]